MPSPYSWQPPPRPEALVLPDGSPFHAPAERTWHRALWGGEKTIAVFGLASAGWTDMFVTAHLEVDSNAPPLTMAVIRKAFRLLRFEHPVIASRLACLKPDFGTRTPSPFVEPRLVYEVPATDEDVETWLTDVVADRSDALERSDSDMAGAVAAVLRDVGAALPAYRPSQFDAYCILRQDGRGLGLVLRFSHAAFDGIGSFVLLDVIVRKLAATLEGAETLHPPLAWGEETQRLAPPVVDNLRIPWKADGPKGEAIVIRNLLWSLERDVGKHNLPLYTPHPGRPPTRTDFLHCSLGETTVEALVQAARRHGSTVSSTAYAASLLATLAITQPANADAFALPDRVSVSLRHKGVLVVDDDVLHAGALAIPRIKNLRRFVHDGNVPKIEEVWELAKEINADIKTQIPQMANIALWGHALDVGTLPPSLLAETLQRDTSMLLSPLLSSLGVVDAYLAPRHGSIALSQPMFTVRSCMTGPPFGPAPRFFIFTWQGTLHVSISYPEAVVGSHKEQVDALKNDEGAKGSLLSWLNTFMDTLEKASESDPAVCDI